MAKMVRTTHWDELSGSEALLDVRTVAEYKKGAVPGAIHIPLNELRDRLDELPRNRPLATFCGQGYRSYIASRILTQNGFTVSNISGGYLMYKNFKDAGMITS
jgi:rhodanese-related sulfurtransferase